jgi:hypothetical protein
MPAWADQTSFRNRGLFLEGDCFITVCLRRKSFEGPPGPYVGPTNPTLHCADYFRGPPEVGSSTLFAATGL